MWGIWALYAMAAAVATLIVGCFFLLGLPGILMIEVIKLIGRGSKYTADMAAGLQISLVGGTLVFPSSLGLRFLARHLVGWSHGIATATVVVALTFLHSAVHYP